MNQDLREKPVRSKPCVCRVFTRTSLVWQATGRENAQGKSEYRCRVCGSTVWR